MHSWSVRAVQILFQTTRRRRSDVALETPTFRMLLLGHLRRLESVVRVRWRDPLLFSRGASLSYIFLAAT